MNQPTEEGGDETPVDEGAEPAGEVAVDEVREVASQDLHSES